MSLLYTVLYRVLCVRGAVVRGLRVHACMRAWLPLVFHKTASGSLSRTAAQDTYLAYSWKYHDSARCTVVIRL